jgi:hypothetical protein
VTKDQGPRPTVFVCSGSSCSESKSWRKLCDSLDAYTNVNEVGCQKICDGPVCGVLTPSGLQWFEDLAGKNVREDFEQFVTVGSTTKRLAERLVKKRKNKLRG